MDLDFLNPDASIPCCSFKLHATVRELYEWTRMEKMKLKEQAVAAIAKEKQAHGQDPCREEKRSPAVNETFEGEMDNFQTPVMRRGASAPFFFTELTEHCNDWPAAVHSAQQSHSPGTSSSLPLLGLRLMILPA
jgi:hypothetical protein